MSRFEQMRTAFRDLDEAEEAKAKAEAAVIAPKKRVEALLGEKVPSPKPPKPQSVRPQWGSESLSLSASYPSIRTRTKPSASYHAVAGGQPNSPPSLLGGMDQFAHDFP